MKKFLNNFIQLLKQDKKKLVIFILCVAILLGSICYFVVKKNTINKLKNEDTAITMLLDTFYGKMDNDSVSELLLGKTRDKYLGEVKQASYDEIYNQLKDLGEDELIDGKTAVDIANDYTDSSIEIISKVKETDVAKKTEIDNGYQFQVEIIPGNLKDAYKQGNDCAAKYLKKLETEDPQFAGLEGHEYAVYYYCLADGMKNMNNDKGEKTTVVVTMNKNDKGQYIPTDSSLKSLLTAAY